VKAALTALLLALAAASPASGAAWRFDGHGWGHGIGLAQYGTLGYARDAHRNATWMLAHYYPGTTLATRPAARVRVRLAEGLGMRLASATLARGADGRRVTLSAARTYALTQWEATGTLLRLVDERTGRGIAHLQSPVRITGATPLRLLGMAENGVRDGRYRGALVLTRTKPGVLAVDDVDGEQYLYGVVASEVPASWPAAALRAQAVAARSYALAGLRPAAPFDVFADTRSQMYKGVAGEAPAATTAVDATRRLAVLSGGRVATTLFSASSGGRTAANEEIYPGADPLPYLRSVDDPYDRLSPYHDWSVSFTAAQASARLGALIPGDLLGLTVQETTPTGRAATVRIIGSTGVRDVPAGTIRSLLGLRSTWFSITSV
jgi:stage II sporulation protein D